MTDFQLRLTNSESRQWKRCKRKWYFGTYKALTRRSFEFNKPLSIGTRLHDVMQHYYVPGLDRPDPMEYFHSRVEQDVEKHPALEVDIRKEAALVEAMLEGYLQWLEEEGADSDIEVIAPEVEMEVGLIDGATILSKIDARVKRVSDGKHGALEHKTAASLTDPVRRLQVDPQVLTEHLVEFLTYLTEDGAEENRAQFVLYNMMKKSKRTARAKPPFYTRHEIMHNITELRNHWRHMARIAAEIQAARAELDAGADHHDVCYPNVTKECTWDCDFRDVCLSGMVDDGTDIRQLLEDSFKVADPLERYRSSVGLPTSAGYEDEPVESPSSETNLEDL